MPVWALYDFWQARGTYILSNRPMHVLATGDARPGTGQCFISRTATVEKRLVFAEVHIYCIDIYIKKFLF